MKTERKKSGPPPIYPQAMPVMTVRLPDRLRKVYLKLGGGKWLRGVLEQFSK